MRNFKIFLEKKRILWIFAKRTGPFALQSSCMSFLITIHIYFEKFVSNFPSIGFWRHNVMEGVGCCAASSKAPFSNVFKFEFKFILKFIFELLKCYLVYLKVLTCQSVPSNIDVMWICFLKPHSHPSLYFLNSYVVGLKASNPKTLFISPNTHCILSI